MDPFAEAAMAELGGVPPEPGMLPGGPLDPSEPDGTVQCQVCQTVIDALDGTPLEPVDASAAEAAQLFVTGGGMATGAEFGGVPLDLAGAPGGAPPAF